MDKLEEQFSELQVEEEIGEHITKLERADEQWSKVNELTDATGQKKYGDLVKLAQGVLLIPHSNASCERVFSNVRKIRTDFRGSLTPHTLESYLYCEAAYAV